MRFLPLITLLAGASGLLHAQGSYEIQVYGSDLVEPGATMFELHSNFTFEGSKNVIDGQYPTEHQLHETLEITHGFSDWFELASTFSPAPIRASAGSGRRSYPPASPFPPHGNGR